MFKRFHAARRRPGLLLALLLLLLAAWGGYALAQTALAATQPIPVDCNPVPPIIVPGTSVLLNIHAPGFPADSNSPGVLVAQQIAVRANDPNVTFSGGSAGPNGIYLVNVVNGYAPVTANTSGVVLPNGQSKTIHFSFYATNNLNSATGGSNLIVNPSTLAVGRRPKDERIVPQAAVFTPNPVYGDQEPLQFLCTVTAYKPDAPEEYVKVDCDDPHDREHFQPTVGGWPVKLRFFRRQISSSSFTIALVNPPATAKLIKMHVYAQRKDSPNALPTTVIYLPQQTAQAK